MEMERSGRTNEGEKKSIDRAKVSCHPSAIVSRRHRGKSHSSIHCFHQEDGVLAHVNRAAWAQNLFNVSLSIVKPRRLAISRGGGKENIKGGKSLEENPFPLLKSKHQIRDSSPHICHF